MRIVRRWAWLLVLCPIAAGGVAFEVSKHMTPLYEGDSTLLIRPAQALNAAGGNTGLTSDQLSTTYAQLMTDPLLLSKVISDLNLPTSPGELGARVTVRPVTGSTLIKVSARDPDPKQARDITNKLVDEFVASNRQLAQRQLDIYTGNLRDQISKLGKSIDGEQAQIDALLVHIDGGTTVSPSDQSKLALLQQQIAADRGHYQELAGQLAQTQAQAALASDSVEPVSPARLPVSPVSPDLRLNVGLAAVAGLLLACGVVAFLDGLDQSIKDVEELELHAPGWTVLAHIPYVRTSGKFGELVAIGRRTPAVEAYRSLRTNFLFASIDKEVKTIAVTSPAPGEGKSRTAANLALVLAAAGHNTLLIDADFRQPSQHRYFGRIANRGLSDAIVRRNEAETLFRPLSGEPRLWLLPSGPCPANPSELVGSTRAKALLTDLRSKFDYVVVDTPPVNAVTDSSLVAAHADATLVVIEQGRTTYGSLRHTRRQLNGVGARVIGIVVNKLRAKGDQYGYPSSYRYYAAALHPAAAVQVEAETVGNGH